MENLLNKITPRLNININSNNLISSVETNVKKKENLFQNYATNKAEKGNLTLSNHNLNTEVSGSTNTFCLNKISKPSLILGIRINLSRKL